MGCRNQTNVHYSIPLVAGAISYNWNAPVGSAFSANNNEITLNFDSAYTTHRLCVSITNACGENQEKCMDVALIVSKPNTPSAIIGSVVACANTTVTYSINSVLRATNYKWTAPTNASIVSGQGSKTVQIAFNNLFTSGNLFVNASNCKGVSPNRLLNVQATPATPGSITGITTNLCGANGVAYSIAPSLTGSTSYTWTVPASATILYGQGSSSITASFASAPFNGNVCVTASNSCGTSTAKCLPTTLYPARPVSIIGPASICANQSAVNFNVMAEPGITYNWMMPQGATVTSGQGSNAVTVNWGNTSGIIKVGAYNACGSQLARSKFVTINCRMEEELNDQVIQLYPNPARDNVELNLVGATLPCTVFLTDLIGKNLLVNTFYKAQSAIDLSALPVGLYFVRIKNEQINKTIRLVKE